MRQSAEEVAEILGKLNELCIAVDRAHQEGRRVVFESLPGYLPGEDKRMEPAQVYRLRIASKQEA
jgi:hypothetical protein